MAKLPFQATDPALLNFQYIEDLSTAYWYSEVLFAAIELKLFMYIEQGYTDTKGLSAVAGCREDKLCRLLASLKRMDLIHEINNRWCNSQASRIYLIPESKNYMGDFFLYRRYIKPNWERLADKVSIKKREKQIDSCGQDDLETKTKNYVRAMDALARQKAEEIAGILAEETWSPPVLDAGGGAGTLCRRIMQTRSDGYAVLFELEGVIRAAKSLYLDQKDWEKIRIIEGDFRNYEFEAEEKFGLILLSNFLHAYGKKEAKMILKKASGLLSEEGTILIHDYFPDRRGISPQKGSLYDLNMMLNTYNGVCHKASLLKEWLINEGFCRIDIKDLDTDSSVIISKRSNDSKKDDISDWIYKAYDTGFTDAVLLTPEKIVTGSWVRVKCMYGCPKYQSNLQCPPNGLSSNDTRKMIDSYKTAILLVGTPPGKEFYQKLLSLEKKAFLSGFHKAFVFGAGHCPFCDKCSEDGKCHFPDKARPSMEGSGIDVYTTAKNAGIDLKPVTQKDQYVKFIGLLLLE